LLVCVCLLIIGAILAKQFRSALKVTVDDTNVVKLFLQKVARFIIATGILVLILTITLAIFSLNNARSQPWWWIVLHIFLRVEEFSIEMCVLVLLSKKKPPVDTERQDIIEVRMTVQ